MEGQGHLVSKPSASILKPSASMLKPPSRHNSLAYGGLLPRKSKSLLGVLSSFIMDFVKTVENPQETEDNRSSITSLNVAKDILTNTIIDVKRIAKVKGSVVHNILEKSITTITSEIDLNLQSYDNIETLQQKIKNKLAKYALKEIEISVANFSTECTPQASEKEIFQHPKEDTNGCKEFTGFEKVAKNLIVKVDTEVEDVEIINTQQGRKSVVETMPVVNSFLVEVYDYRTRSVVWPLISEFTSALGRSKLYEFLNSLSFKEDWVYCIDYKGVQSDKTADYYVYEAIWSIPTNSYPVSQTTASMIFTITVSRVTPKSCPVDVTYQYESSRFVHKLGQVEFNENFLFQIIDAKINFFKTLDF